MMLMNFFLQQDGTVQSHQTHPKQLWKCEAHLHWSERSHVLLFSSGAYRVGMPPQRKPIFHLVWSGRGQRFHAQHHGHRVHRVQSHCCSVFLDSIHNISSFIIIKQFRLHMVEIIIIMLRMVFLLDYETDCSRVCWVWSWTAEKAANGAHQKFQEIHLDQGILYHKFTTTSH